MQKHAQNFNDICGTVQNHIVSVMGFMYRSGWTRNAKILSLWRHCEHRFTYGINWRRLALSFQIPGFGTRPTLGLQGVGT